MLEKLSTEEVSLSVTLISVNYSGIFAGLLSLCWNALHLKACWVQTSTADESAFQRQNLAVSDLKKKPSKFQMNEIFLIVKDFDAGASLSVDQTAPVFD